MPPSISESPAEPEVLPKRRLWPADYYASATPQPVLPRGVSYGCGGLAVVVLLIVFAGGTYLGSGGFSQLMDFTFGMTLGDMRGMYTAEVTKAQKDAMEREIETMREHARTKGLPPAAMQSVLQTIQKAIKDSKLTPAEVDAITAAAKKTTNKKR